MKHPQISDLIQDVHEEIVNLIRRWDTANYNGNEKRYLEYTYSIAEKVNELKALKRREKLYGFIEKVKKAINKIG